MTHSSSAASQKGPMGKICPQPSQCPIMVAHHAAPLLLQYLLLDQQLNLKTSKNHLSARCAVGHSSWGCHCPADSLSSKSSLYIRRRQDELSGTMAASNRHPDRLPEPRDAGWDHRAQNMPASNSNSQPRNCGRLGSRLHRLRV